MPLATFEELFFSSLRSAPKGSLASRLDLAKEAEISQLMDLCPIQESFRFRARYLGLKVAYLVIDDEGELDKDYLEELNRLFSLGIFLLGPRREGDAMIYTHLKDSLRLLEENKEIWAAIRKFSPPLAHKKAEEVVRNTLWPEQMRSVQTVHVRRAVIAAWLTLLRQTAGSCFGTAPAILIQQKYPLSLFKDLYDILSTGRMKRIVAGKEYSVPLSPNSGTTDLQKPLQGFVLESLPFSPGLLAAFEAAEIFSPQKSIEGKRDRIFRLLTQGELPQSIEKFISSVLLEEEGLTEEDLADEENLSKIQMTPLLAKQVAVYYQPPSERSQKISNWKRRFSKACLAFQSIAECALLRCWEYTLASFCDVKVDFARWNLYVGLGLHPDNIGGIGYFLYQTINALLQSANEEASRYHQEYEQVAGAVRATESLIHGSTSDSHRNQLKSELSTYVYSANIALEMRDKAAEKADALAGFFSSLIRQYDQKFQDYFQELFDPSLFGEAAHLYEDSPAGFRLVYKHGRTDSSQWTSIHNGEQYIEALRDFFSVVEMDLEIPSLLGRELLTQITTALIQFIQEPEFLESAIQRAKEKGRQSPWDYISGGTMETLLQAYCSRDRPFTEVSFVPHSEEQVLQVFEKEGIGKNDPLLVHSPTHAFIFIPRLIPSSWEMQIEQNRQWNQKRKLDEHMQEYLSHRLSDRLPGEEKALFLHLFRQKQNIKTPQQLRENFIDCLRSIKGSRIKNPIGLVDSLFFENLPLFPFSEAKMALNDLLNHLSVRHKLAAKKWEPKLQSMEGSFMGPLEIYQTTKEILFNLLMRPFSSVDWDWEIAETMRHIGISSPHPIIFADTNWSDWFFGFIVNPVTNQLELWRLNRTALQGYPMNDWKEWMDAKNTAPWIILSKSKEYTEFL